MSQLEPLMKQNFLEYASYVIVDRAIPDLRDGFKPVQRRILQTLFEMNDGRFHKVANVIGDCMKLHPHGDASIGDALVVVANKNYFIEKQGNFGNPLTGHKAAAARYIECRLKPLALETIFNKHLTEFIPSYDGRKEEPVAFPAKIPVALMLGTEGIAVGMSTKILPHNFPELLQAQVQILEKKKPEIFPDFFSGGLIDVSEYEDGLGKVKVRALIEHKNDKVLVIRELPYGVTTESLIASIEGAIQKGRVKIAGISDFTTDKVEIELTLTRGVYTDEVLPQLYAYTDCEVSLSSNIVLIKGKSPVIVSVTEILEFLTKQLRGIIKAELEYELAQLENKQHWLTLEQIFIEQKVYKRLEKAKTEKSVHKTVHDGMMQFEMLFVRPLVDDDIKRLLEIRIRRISAFDIEKNRKQIDDIIKDIKSARSKLRNLTKTTISYLKGLIKAHSKEYPRMTKLRTFKAVDLKEVARQNIKLSYDPKKGFFGSKVRGTHFPLTASEYDKILTVSSDGTYRIMAPPEKVLLPKKVLYLDFFDIEEGMEFIVVYRDKKKFAYAKRVQVLKFIHDKEYQFIKNKEGKIDLLIPSPKAKAGKIDLEFAPAPRQRQKKLSFNLAELEVVGVGTKGTRLAPKAVKSIKMVK